MIIIFFFFLFPKMLISQPTYTYFPRMLPEKKKMIKPRVATTVGKANTLTWKNVDQSILELVSR